MRTSPAFLAAVVLAAASPVLHAQEAPARFKGDIGFTVAPLFKTYIDEPSCCTPPGAWLTWGTGKFRLQADYTHNRRRQLSYPGYYEEHQGHEIVVLRAYRDDFVEHVGSAALYWRLSENARVTPHLLVGLVYINRANRRCVAQGEPLQRIPARTHDPDELLYRVEFVAGEERRCLNEPHPTFNGILPQAGLGFDIPIGSRFFARAQVRAPVLEFRIGAGLRF